MKNQDKEARPATVPPPVDLATVARLMLRFSFAIIPCIAGTLRTCGLHFNAMPTLVRLIVTWLLAVALPIQGLAAATMLHCGSAPQPRVAMPSNAVHAHDHHARMHSQADVGGAHSHHHAHDLPSAQHADAKAAGHHHSGGTDGCSVCASCCGAVALPVMPLVLAPQDLAETTAEVRNVPTVVFQTDGPERPPRTTLA